MTTILLDEPIRYTSTGISDDLTGGADTLVGVRSVWPEQTARTFESERDSFEALLPTLMTTHAGQHVVIQNGIVVDQDVSRQRLLKRFFGVVHGNDPVYIGFVGPQRAVRVPTPFFRRP
jgi:hypothetical protein